MTSILEIGRYLQIDSSGFIVSESSVEKIKEPWSKAVEDIKNCYLSHLGDKVHSIYVRGTVSRGEAIEGISDIDTFAVISGDLTTIDRSWIKSERERLEATHTFSTGVELHLYPLEQLIQENDFFDERFVIKAQSACVYGKDLSDVIQGFQINKELASHFHRNLHRIFANVRKNTTNNTDDADIKEWCRWVMKRIIRAGFTLVMDREKKFTRDLYPCYLSFITYYPDKQVLMYDALTLAIEPTSDVKKIIAIVNDLGEWLRVEIENYFK